MQSPLIKVPSLVLVLFTPGAGAAAVETEPMLTSSGAMLVLVPLACIAAAILRALRRKRPTSYQGSYDILKQRRFASETKQGFFERMRDELKDDVRV